MTTSRILRIACLVVWFLSGCASNQPDVTGGGTQLATRQIQTREYHTLDQSMTLRSVIAEIS